MHGGTRVDLPAAGVRRLEGDGKLVLVVSLEPAFLLSFVVDLAWLWATAALAGLPVRRWRLLSAAALGAAGAVWSYFPSGRWLTGWWGLLSGTLCLLALAYGPRRIGEWLRAGTYLLFTGVVMAGTVLLLSYRGTSPAGAATGAVPAPAGAAAAVGILLSLTGIRRLWEAARERSRLRGGLYGLRISLGGRSVEVPALLDTGNRLRDPVSGAPVAVVEAKALTELLPPALLAAAAGGWQRLDGVTADFAGRVRLVPFQAVGAPSGLLLALAPDQMALREPDSVRWVPVTGLAGLAPEPLHREGAYKALLSPLLLQTAGSVPGMTGEGETG